MPSSMLTSMHVGAVLDLLARDVERGRVVVGLDQLAELARTR